MPIRELFVEKNKTKLLLLVLLLALAVRLWVFPVVFSNGEITLLGADTYYHARRILATAANFPHALSFDSYINYPYGSSIGWPPLYDITIAAAALMIGLGSPSLYTIEATAAVVPLLLGVLTVLVVFLIAEKLFDWRTALISAGIFSITPAHVYVSFLGYADHHVAETFLSTAAYLFFIVALKRLEKNGSVLKNSLFPVLAGVMLALSIFTWDGAPIFIGLIGIYIPVQFVINRKFERNSDYLLITGSIAFLVSLLIITPVAISRGRGFEIYSYLPSLFHVGFLAVFFSLCVLLGLVQKMQFKKWWHDSLLLLFIFAAGASSIEFFSPQFYQSAAYGVQYLLGGGILATIQEAVPLFNNPAGGFTLDNVWRAFTVSFFIALLMLIYFIHKTRKETYPSGAVFLIVWTFIVLALTLLQRRFIYLLSVNIAVFSAYFVTAAIKPFSEQKQENTRKRRKGKKKNNVSSKAAIIVGLFLLFILSVPNLTVIKFMATENVAAPASDLKESFTWLKDSSPATSYYSYPDKPAEYGVMSWWDYGNWILYLSQRPVVANNFQTGIDDAAHFLTASDEKTASEVLNARKVRFIVTDAQMLKLKFKSIAMLAGKNPDDYYGTSDDAPIRSVNAENRNFFATMLSRLHVFDGDGLSNYRLIYESGTTAIRSPDLKYVKIFEYVPGATIAGKADGDVKLTLSVMTNQRRIFEYTRQVTASNGSYEIKVPYATQGGKYATAPLSDYIIQTASKAKAVSVNEQDVLEGRILRVDLT